MRAVRRSLLAQVDHARRRAGLRGAAEHYLGLSEAELQSRLAHGQSLASVAESLPGHSRKGLLDAIVAIRRETVERAVREKRIKAAEGRVAIAAPAQARGTPDRPLGRLTRRGTAAERRTRWARPPNPRTLA